MLIVCLALAQAYVPSQTLLWSANRAGYQGEVWNGARSPREGIAFSPQGGMRVRLPQSVRTENTGFLMKLGSLSEDIRLRFELHSGSRWARWEVPIPAGEHLDVFFDPTAKLVPMPPPVFKSYYRHVMAASNILGQTADEFRLELVEGSAANVSVGSLFAVRIPILATGWIDEFGQLKLRDWPGKIRTANELRSQVDPRIGEPSVQRISKNSPSRAWRLTKNERGFWHLMTPEGKPFWSLGVAAVNDLRPTKTTHFPSAFAGGAHAPSSAIPLLERNLQIKYGADWKAKNLAKTADRLRRWGINTMGSGTNGDDGVATETPFVVSIPTHEFPSRIQVPFSFGKSLPDPFDPQFAYWIANRWSGLLQSYSRSPYFIGFYTDGELPWGLDEARDASRLQVPIAILQASSGHAKSYLPQFFRERYRSPSDFNSTYGTAIRNWEDLRSRTLRVPLDRRNLLTSDRIRGDLELLLERVAAQYAKTVVDARNRMKVESLYLGSRDFADVHPAVFRGLAKHSDVVSFNLYARARQFPWSQFHNLGKPVMLTEFSFVAQEGNSMSGVGFSPTIVAPDQYTRAKWAEEVLYEAAREPNCVGAHWFTYSDQPVTGNAVNDENYAMGLINVVDQPYEPLVRMFRRFSDSVARLRR